MEKTVAEEKRKLPIMGRVGVIFLTWRRYQENGMRPHKMTLKQFYLLNQLAKREFLYPSEISEMLFCDRPTATVIIDNLKKYGWVQKLRDPNNGKRTQILITPQGKDKLGSIEMHFKSDEAPFDPLACFDEEEKATFEKLLIKLHQHIKQVEKP